MKRLFAFSLLAIFVWTGCVTQKKKGDVSGFKRGYHSLTSHYNYWFNADELFHQTVAKLENGHQDNYNQLLPIYPELEGESNSKSDFENVIKKSSRGIALHRVGRWTDDNYVLLGAAQYMKRDFETAEETFKYIQEEYNPNKKNKAKLKGGTKPKKDTKAKKGKKKSSKKKAVKKKKKKKKKSSSKKKTADKNKTAADKAAASKEVKGKTTETATGKKSKKDAANEELKAVTADPYGNGWRRDAAYPEAMVWYGRTLIERDKYEEADFLFRALEEDPHFPEKMKDELAVAQSHLYIRQKRYDQAIPSLERAVKYTHKKRKRGRYAFILAQLYERAGRHEEAYAAYNRVLAANPRYEMEFNARLHQIEAGWANGKISGGDALRALERMGKDEKNKDYRDQVYYVMAGIDLKENRIPDAIVHLRQSLQFNSGNSAQRTESYLKLADLYFDTEDFVNAKSYYDSTLTVLATTDPRHALVTGYANNLTDIARLITTIAQNDSIIRVAQMSDSDRKTLAKTIRKQRATAAAADAAAADLAARNAKNTPAPTAPGPTAGQKNSTFYFYNDAFLKKGRKEFPKNWGDRKLEDNWRRSRRPATANVDEAAKKDSTATDLTESDVSDIFKDLPKNAEELSVLHAANYESLFQLGTLFRDKLLNNRKSTQTLENMQQRYPDTVRHEVEAWYYCYIGFSDLNNKEKAQYYYDKLVNKYPTSNYARALTDPNFVNAGKQREKELNDFYEQTFKTYQSGDYKTTHNRCEEAPKKYGSQNPIMAKFALLGALCIGNLQGNDAYCQALNDVIARFPNTAESTRAKEIARLLSCKGFEVTDDKSKTGGEPRDDAFMEEDDKLHYFIVALKGSNVKTEDIKVAISDYNRENHREKQLRVTNIFLDPSTEFPLLVMRKFDTAEQAMRYYNEVKDKKDFLGETDKRQYNKEYFVITQENYRRVLKNKTLDGYREFFIGHYLKKK
jgi:tetratricopeptide (TPR) repeat protein